MIAVDFTGSNGDPKAPNSLHYNNPNQMNQYQSALYQVSEILLIIIKTIYFIPMYGFGGVPNFPNYQKNEADHCFPLTGSFQQPEVFGLEGIMTQYIGALHHVKLSGPTYFAPIIQYACQTAQQNVNHNIYSVLMILTDGEIHDMNQTIQLIKGAAKIPLSIIIIGVGDEKFQQMKTLDGDNGQLKGQCARDLVQFVPFRNFKQQGELAKEVLQKNQQKYYYSRIAKLVGSLQITIRIITIKSCRNPSELNDVKIIKNIKIKNNLFRVIIFIRHLYVFNQLLILWSNKYKQINSYLTIKQKDREKIELYFSGRGLADKDLISESDPQCYIYLKIGQDGEEKLIGKTEVKENNLNPDWKTSIVLDFIFEMHQFLRIVVMDHDGDKIENDDIIGTLNTTVGTVMGSKNQIYIGQLTHENKNTGRLIIKADKRKGIGEANQMIYWQWSATKVKNMDGWFGVSDPFIRFLKWHMKSDWLLVLQIQHQIFIQILLQSFWKLFIFCSFQHSTTMYNFILVIKSSNKNFVNIFRDYNIIQDNNDGDIRTDAQGLMCGSNLMTQEAIASIILDQIKQNNNA